MVPVLACQLLSRRAVLGLRSSAKSTSQPPPRLLVLAPFLAEPGYDTDPVAPAATG